MKDQEIYYLNKIIRKITYEWKLKIDFENLLQFIFMFCVTRIYVSMHIH